MVTQQAFGVSITVFGSFGQPFHSFGMIGGYSISLPITEVELDHGISEPLFGGLLEIWQGVLDLSLILVKQSQIQSRQRIVFFLNCQLKPADGFRQIPDNTPARPVE